MNKFSKMHASKRFKEDESFKRCHLNTSCDSDDNEDDDDDDDTEVDYNDSSQSLNKSAETYARYVQTSRSSPDSSKNTSRFSSQESSFNDSQYSSKNSRHSSKPKRKESIKINDKSPVTNYSAIKWLIAALVIILGFFYYQQSSTAVHVSNDIVLNDITETLRSMKSRFKEQEKSLWRNIYGGIAQAFDIPTKPSIIILLGSSVNPLNCLAVMVGNVSSMALHTKTLQLTPKDLDSNTGLVIEKLRSEISQQKSVVIWDLLNIDNEALKAFHNLCDRHNPLVNQVILTIVVLAENYNTSSDPLQFIENSLTKKLSGKVNEDIIQPLISRITDGVVLSVKPEPYNLDCPLSKIGTRY